MQTLTQVAGSDPFEPTSIELIHVGNVPSKKWTYAFTAIAFSEAPVSTDLRPPIRCGKSGMTW